MLRFLKPACLILLLLNTTTLYADESQRIVDNPLIVSLINDMVKKHGFDKQYLISVFSKAEFKPEIIERINRPAESWPWYRYRKLFLKQKRIEQGVQFWKKNEKVLQRAEKTFGVPAQIIVAILGVETRYGRNKGQFRLIDSLSTLVVDYPKRSNFFKKELEQLLLLAREEKFDPLSLTGSYAGAMGKPQFIASSYRHYAIDFDHDGVRDLLSDTADAVGSVASYLARHGWVRGETIAAEASISGNRYKKLIQKGLKPQLKFASFKSYGVQSNTAIRPDWNAALIELEKTKTSQEQWIVLQNFYAITRYNHSPLYAMAAFQLGESIKALKNKQT